jgi:hypothetical protein
MLFAGIVLLAACSSSDEYSLTIASKRSYYCDGESGIIVPMYLIKKGNSWTGLTKSISGFTYKAGYEYVIEVRDIDDNRLQLENVKSEIKKESANLLSTMTYNEEWPAHCSCDSIPDK